MKFWIISALQRKQQVSESVGGDQRVKIKVYWGKGD